MKGELLREGGMPVSLAALPGFEKSRLERLQDQYTDLLMLQDRRAVAGAHEIELIGRERELERLETEIIQEAALVAKIIEEAAR